MMTISDKDMALLQRCWTLGKGKTWEPADPFNPFIVRMVAAGFLWRSDGRCGFEAFKDSFVNWTDAGRLAMTGLAAKAA